MAALCKYVAVASTGSLWIPALWGHICNHNVTFTKRIVLLHN